jgi:hypothetical protein
MPGEIKKGRGALIGNAGEYAVMSELLRRGWIAALAPRNAPDFDIMATDREVDVRIPVKTKSAHYEAWQWMSKNDGTAIRHLGYPNDFFVLLDLRPETTRNDYYILPTETLSKILNDDFEVWKATPGVRGRPHDPAKKHRGLSVRKHKTQLEQYREAWHLLSHN